MEPPPLNPQSPASPTPTPETPTKDTRLGTVIRVAFFVATVYVSVKFLTSALYMVFGVLVAGTLGLGATGLLANLLTMKIFDRRPFTDIGLQLGRLSALQFHHRNSLWWRRCCPDVARAAARWHRASRFA